jgi:iron complex outermembrane receptor protein
MFNLNKNGTQVLLPLLIGLLISGTATAAGLEEIVVTAQKVTQNVQTVPIAVTAFTQSELETKGINSVAKMSDFAPNVTLDAGTPFSGSDNVLAAYIRGIGQNDFAFNQDPGVGVYVDGVFLARSVGSNTNMLDVDRVEILKGPQGTLFGRNTIGGAISIITHEPGDEFTAKGEVTGGSFNRLDFQGAMDLPITDKILTTVAFSRKSRDGWQKRVPFPGNFAGSSGIPDCDNLLPAGTRCSNNPVPYDTQPAAAYKTSKREGGQDQWTVRGKVVFLPTDDLKITATGDYTWIDQSATPTTQLAIDTSNPAVLGNLSNTCITLDAATLNAIGLGLVCNQPRLNVSPVPTPVPALPNVGGINNDGNPNNDISPYDSRFITGKPGITYATGNSFSKMTNWGATGIIDYDINDAMHVKSITGYRRMYWRAGIDADSSPQNILQVAFTMPQHQLSQELQFTGTIKNSVDYVFGGYYFKEKGHLHDFVTFPMAYLMIDGPNDLSTESEAVYGHLNIRVTDEWAVVAGGRFTIEHKTFEGFQTDGNGLTYKGSGCFPPSMPNNLGAPAFLDCQQVLGFPNPAQPYRYFPPGKRTLNFKNFSPTIGLQYTPNDDMMFYLTMSQGYKTGSWTTRLSNPHPTYDDSLHFNPEEAFSQEVGMKSEWLNNSVRLNVAGFHTLYSNIQLNSQQGISPTLLNAGDARMWGFEVESQADLGNGLSMIASVGFVDARYIRINPGVGDNGINIDTSFKIPKTPKWKFYFGPQYVMNVPFGGELQFNMDYTHITKVYNDLGNTELLARPTSDMVNASVTYRLPGDKYSLTVGATNLTDERNIINGQFQGGVANIYGTYNDPREWYATLRASY